MFFRDGSWEPRTVQCKKNGFFGGVQKSGGKTGDEEKKQTPGSSK